MDTIVTSRVELPLEPTIVTTSTIYMVLSKQQRAVHHRYFRGRFSHGHKGKKPKRGNPYR